MKIRPSWVRLTVPSIEFSMATKPHVDRAVGHGLQHGGHRDQGDELTGSQVRLAQQRLLGEGAERPQEADPQAARGDEGTWAE